MNTNNNISNDEKFENYYNLQTIIIKNNYSYYKRKDIMMIINSNWKKKKDLLE